MKRKAQLRLENLEDRTVPAIVGVIPPGISLDPLGTLHIIGDGRQDDASVWIAGGQLHAEMWQSTWKTIAGQKVQLSVPTGKVFVPANVKRISFVGNGSSDSFSNQTDIPCTALGGAGDDHLIGGGGDDQLQGGSGQDILEGRGGANQLKGGVGDDWYVYNPLGAAKALDTIFEVAGAGEDTLDFSGLDQGVTVDISTGVYQTVYQTAAGGDLTISLTNSGNGVENVVGSSAGDHITGNYRSNSIHGNGGSDTISGGDGNDEIWGGF